MSVREDVTKLVVVGFFMIALLPGCHFEDHGTGPWHAGHRSYVEDLDYPLYGDGLSALQVETVNGSIAVTGTDRTDGVIHVRKKVWADSDWEAESFARKVEIVIERRVGTVRAHATYPRTPNDVSVEVSFDIECRNDASLDVLTVNGEVEISGLRAGVAATTVNGAIDAELRLLRGEGRFASTNGSIDLRMARCRGPLAASTVNGSIEVALSDDFAGLLHAQTANGSIRCCLPLSQIHAQTPTNLSGRIGTGNDTPISLQSVNGSLRVCGL